MTNLASFIFDIIISIRELNTIPAVHRRNESCPCFTVSYSKLLSDALHYGGDCAIKADAESFLSKVYATGELHFRNENTSRLRMTINISLSFEKLEFVIRIVG